MDLSNLIAYYKDCYQADTRTFTLTNFLTAKVENRLILSGKDELFSGGLPYYPVSDDYAAEVIKNLTIYKREKVLYCAAFFVLGRQEDSFQKNSKVCAPLILYPASVVEMEEGHGIKLDYTRPTVNINFLNTIKKDGVEDLYEEVLDSLKRERLESENIGHLKRTLEKLLNDIDGEELLMYPELSSEYKIKKKLQASVAGGGGNFKVISAMGFGIIKRSSTTQGIISELLDMSKKTDLSAPLKYLFDYEATSKVGIVEQGYIPAILSDAQERIIEAANNNVLSMVVGPPGTGKSYTIAALAIEQMSKGKKVLIASKTDEAVDVIDRKIRKDLAMDGVSVRAGKSEYKKKLKGHLSNLLSGSRRRPNYDIQELHDLKADIRRNKRANEEIEQQFIEQIEHELDWAQDAADFNKKSGLFDKIKMTYLRWKNSKLTPHWQLTSQFLNNNEKYIDLIKTLIKKDFDQRVHEHLYSQRGMFRDFLKSITARQSSRQDELFEGINLHTLMNAFPIWSINLSDIYDVLPMEKELFDLLIIDEASQCDMASCLPAMQRAKKVVIVGDPKQLRHVSFISRSMQYSLQKKHKIEVSSRNDLALNYRNTSILDLVDDRIDSQHQVNFLNEHYRSKPPIIRFSNETFYDSALSIMTSMHNATYHDPISLVRCDGTRDKSGINKEEADAIIERVKKYIKDEEKVNEQLCHSIGILSPFRDQVEYLGKRLNDLDVGHISKHNITCGTAYSFQGEERDIMFISLAIDDDSHHSAVLHMNKSDVFNVAITRARVKQYLFQSFTSADKGGEHLAAYLSQVQEDAIGMENPDQGSKDVFMEEVMSMLEAYSIEIWSDFSIAGLAVDIAFKCENRFYGIDLIGYPGVYQAALEINDYKTLKRAGIETFALPYTYWKFDKDNCITELLQFIGIKPPEGQN